MHVFRTAAGEAAKSIDFSHERVTQSVSARVIAQTHKHSSMHTHCRRTSASIIKRACVCILKTPFAHYVNFTPSQLPTQPDRRHSQDTKSSA